MCRQKKMWNKPAVSSKGVLDGCKTTQPVKVSIHELLVNNSCIESFTLLVCCFFVLMIFSGVHFISEFFLFSTLCCILQIISLPVADWFFEMQQPSSIVPGSMCFSQGQRDSTFLWSAFYIFSPSPLSLVQQCGWHLCQGLSFPPAFPGNSLPMCKAAYFQFISQSLPLESWSSVCFTPYCTHGSPLTDLRGGNYKTLFGLWLLLCSTSWLLNPGKQR